MLGKHSLLLTLVFACSLNPLHLVDAQDDNPPGFLSIDCGFSVGSSYKEERYTGLYYISDANLIDSGESFTLSPSIIGNDVWKPLETVRSFPQGKKNCYTIQPLGGKGTKYLIRASFLYGNYDSLNQLPTFDLNLGADTWSNIVIKETTIDVRKEIIHVLTSDYIHICLVKTGTTTPFISALELRPLNTSMYPTESGSLETLIHVDCDSTKNNFIRYPNDIFDRRWISLNWTSTRVSTLFNINNTNVYFVPAGVLRTASRPDNANDPFQFYWDTTDPNQQLYFYMHFSEVEKLEANETREFNIYKNGIQWYDQSVVPGYLTSTTIVSKGPETGNTRYNFVINKTESSTLPPIISGYEIYAAKKFSNIGTNESDVASIRNIKSTYGVIRDWQGDPCEPEDFVWDGLQCSYHSSDYSARIISLNLSANGLTGVIVPSLANLTELKTLDLSYNNLSGQVPEFLSQLGLSVLNLKGNNFTGPFPAQLLENRRLGILLLSFDRPGNDTSTELCGAEPCKKKGNKSTRVVAGAVVGSVLLLAAISFGIWIFRRRASREPRNLGNQHQVNNGAIVIDNKRRQFTYAEVLSITENLRTVLGKGGFGTVYHGSVGDTQVAVKMLSPSSTQGYKEFQAEANLLLSVSHKNITSLVGYCNEGTNMGIIYEYMAKGSLDEHLSGKKYAILNWETRLQIALDAAQGLDYLHHGCKPAIIHRDVKTSNILLNEQFQAKLADFGLSRAYSEEGGTHVSTVVVGTPGYLDPDYITSNRLTEKSDVFSFGVVLLVMITGRPVFLTTEEDRTHIAQWVDSIVQHGDVKQVVDPRIIGNYNVDCVWKAVELAMTCASQISSTRPTMNTVVMELKECLAIEIGSHDLYPNNSNVIGSMDLESSSVPGPR